MYNNYIIILSIVIVLSDFTPCYANTTSKGYIKGGNIFRGKVYFCILYILFVKKIYIGTIYKNLNLNYSCSEKLYINIQIIL